MKTDPAVKKLGGYAGTLFVSAELSKRGIPNAILPEGYPRDDIFLGEIGGNSLARIQVKSCHPDRSESFYLSGEDVELW